MKQKITRARKARRLNCWEAYQKWYYTLSVFERRVRGFLGADHAVYSQKYRELDNAVEGYKQRLALQSNGIHSQVR